MWGLVMGAEAGGQSRVGHGCDVGCLGGCKEVVYGVVCDRPACSACCRVHGLWSPTVAAVPSIPIEYA